MLPVRFESTISAGEQLQTYALDCAAAVIGFGCFSRGKYWFSAISVALLDALGTQF